MYCSFVVRIRYLFGLLFNVLRSKIPVIFGLFEKRNSIVVFEERISQYRTVEELVNKVKRDNSLRYLFGFDSTGS